MGSRDSSPQALGPLAEILKVVRLRDLRHLTNLLCLVDLDPELLHLLLQPLLTGGDLERHAVEDPGQVPELVGPPRDFRETLGIERVGLEGVAAAVSRLTGPVTQRARITEATRPTLSTPAATTPASLRLRRIASRKRSAGRCTMVAAIA